MILSFLPLVKVPEPLLRRKRGNDAYFPFAPSGHENQDATRISFAYLDNAFLATSELQFQIQRFIEYNLFGFFGAYSMLRDVTAIVFVPIKQFRHLFFLLPSRL
jgi:hypothetical protein